MTTIQLKAKDLVLRDKVNLLNGEPFGWGTVVQITDEEVHIIRPYVHTADFDYTGGVLHYLGTETVKIWIADSRELTVDRYTHDKVRREQCGT